MDIAYFLFYFYILRSWQNSWRVVLSTPTKPRAPSKRFILSLRVNGSGMRKVRTRIRYRPFGAPLFSFQFFKSLFNPKSKSKLRNLKLIATFYKVNLKVEKVWKLWWKQFFIFFMMITMINNSLINTSLLYGCNKLFWLKRFKQNNKYMLIFF